MWWYLRLGGKGELHRSVRERDSSKAAQPKWLAESAKIFRCAHRQGLCRHWRRRQEIFDDTNDPNSIDLNILNPELPVSDTVFSRESTSHGAVKKVHFQTL